MKLPLTSADHFQYLKNETHYTWPLDPEETSLRLSITADDEIKVYLADQSQNLLPVGKGTSFTREYRLTGFCELLVKCKKTTTLGCLVMAQSKREADPLSYAPVDIGPPPSQSEASLMQSAIRAEMQRLGIQSEDEFDPIEEADLDFFEEDGEIGATIYSEEMLPLREEEETSQPEGEENSVETEETPSEDAETPTETVKE